MVDQDQDHHSLQSAKWSKYERVDQGSAPHVHFIIGAVFQQAPNFWLMIKGLGQRKYQVNGNGWPFQQQVLTGVHQPVAHAPHAQKVISG